MATWTPAVITDFISEAQSESRFGSEPYTWFPIGASPLNFNKIRLYFILSLIIHYSLLTVHCPAPWQFLYFLPLPHGQGSFLPTFFSTCTGWGFCFSCVLAFACDNRSDRSSLYLLRSVFLGACAS